MIDWEMTFKKALRFDQFLETYGAEEEKRRWRVTHDAVPVSDDQISLLKGFRRDMNVLCLASAQCGDCARQCPILERFAGITPVISLRFVDRDAAPELSTALRICGGSRVPVVIFLSEDFYECGRHGDRTLSRYRELAAGLPGAVFPTTSGGLDQSLRAVTADWLNEFERIQLMLRLSARLRQKHGD